MKYKKSKIGFTLIEVIISISIITILLPVIFKTLLFGVKEYNKLIEKSIEIDNIDNAMVIIDNILTDNYIESIENNNNKIEILIRNKHGVDLFNKKVVFLRGNTLYVATYFVGDSDVLLNNRVVLSDVKEFTVNNKEKLIYFIITTEKEVSRVRCM